MYVCRLLCRILSPQRDTTPAPLEADICENAPIFYGDGPIAAAAPDVFGAMSFFDQEEEMHKSDCDSMNCNEGDVVFGEPEPEQIATNAKALPGRLAGAVRGSLEYMGDKWDAIDGAAERVTQKVETTVASVREKAADTVITAEEKAARNSKQLGGMISSKVAFFEGKTRATYTAIDASASKTKQQLGQQTAAMADKTKAAANFMRTKSGEFASTARTKSGEIQEMASSTKGKLQAVGQTGIRAMASKFAFKRGGA